MAGEQHLLLEIGGSYTSASGASSEIWATTLRFAIVFGTVDDTGTLPSTLGVLTHEVNRVETGWTIVGNWKISNLGIDWSPDDWLNDVVAGTVSTWIATVIASSVVTVETLKLYPIIGPSGKAIPNPDQTQGSPMTLTFTGTLPHGGGTSFPLPLQNSVVASHRTQQVGRRGRGRMYLPVMAADGIDAAGRLTSTRQADVLAAQVAMVGGLYFSGTGTDLFNVRPIVTGKPYAKYGVISEVQVGNVMDTQRRRRDRLEETRISTPITY